MAKKPNRDDEIVELLAVLGARVFAVENSIRLAREAAKRRTVAVTKLRGEVSAALAEFKDRTDHVLASSNTDYNAAKAMERLLRQSSEQMERIEALLTNAVSIIGRHTDTNLGIKRAAQAGADRVDELATSVALLVEELREIRKGAADGKADLQAGS